MTFVCMFYLPQQGLTHLVLLSTLDDLSWEFSNSRSDGEKCHLLDVWSNIADWGHFLPN